MHQDCRTLRSELMSHRIPRVNQAGADGVGEPTLLALFDSQETPLLRYAYSLVGRRAVAEEIVQEIFLELHKRWDEVDAPRAWLFRSVRNRALNHLRDNRRLTLDSDDCQAPSLHCADATAETTLLRREALRALRQHVEQLDDVDRRLVELKYFENLKYREISAKTGLSVGNVGYRLHHILKELAGKLRPLGIDELP
ncbi:MAG: sigma-70 family RNA polymerase sigma factor [Planctomycetota bacterium]